MGLPTNSSVFQTDRTLPRIRKAGLELIESLGPRSSVLLPVLNQRIGLEVEPELSGLLERLIARLDHHQDLISESSESENPYGPQPLGVADRDSVAAMGARVDQRAGPGNDAVQTQRGALVSVGH